MTDDGSSRALAVPIVLGLGALVLRLVGIDYNGPFTDESYYAYAAEDGNVDNIIGEAYLWPVIAGWTYSCGGVIASRVVTALFGAATVVFVYAVAREFGRRFTGDRGALAAGVAAGVLCATAGSTFYISRFATYDAPAVMLLALGFGWLVRGVESGARTTLLFAAIAFTMAAMTRYMVILFLPVGLVYAIGRAIVVGRAPRVLRWFVAPFALITGLYGWFSFRHIQAAIGHAERADAGKVVSSFGRLVVSAYQLVGPAFVVLAAIGFGVVFVRSMRRRSVPMALDAVFLLGAAWLVVVHHAYRESGFSFHKNLATGVVFASILGGLGFAELFAVASSRGRVGRAVGWAALLAAGVATFVAQRKITWVHERLWPDFRPLIAVVHDANLGPAPKIFATKGEIAVALRAEFGPGVDQRFPWFLPTPKAVLKTAARRGVQYVVGPVHSGRLERGSLLHGFVATDFVEMSRQRGRAYVFKRAQRRIVVPFGGDSAARAADAFGVSPSGRLVLALEPEDVSRVPVRITQIGLRAAAANGWAADRIRVRVAHGVPDAVGATLLAFDRHRWDEPVTVFDGPLRFRPGRGPWLPLKFAVSFGYDGLHPLLLEVDYQCPQDAPGFKLANAVDGPRLALRLDHTCVLRASRPRVPPGRRVHFELSGARPGSGYRIVSSFSHAPRRIGDVTIGLGWDPLTWMSRNLGEPMFKRYSGSTRPDGRATAVFCVPDVPELRGLTTYHAAILLDGNHPIAASNTCAVQVD